MADDSTIIRDISARPGLNVVWSPDSAGEADLGRSLYSAVCRFAQSLEDVGPAPLFQYVITTTTEPPVRYRQTPWLRLQLQGVPEDERLFMVTM